MNTDPSSADRGPDPPPVSPDASAQIEPPAPRVSVILPTYNHAALLSRCLDAILAQDFPRAEYEVLVVDDGSTDDTATIVAAYVERMPSAVRYLRQRNRGPAAARNAGADAARGEILVFTDDDCEPERNWLREMLRPMESDPDLAAVKGAYRTRQDSLIARFAQAEFEARYRKLQHADHVDFVDTYSAAIRASVFHALGGFDTSFPKANNEDVEFSYRMEAHGYTMAFNPAAIVYHQHPATLAAYLQTKFGRAYWRMVVYRSFPGKMSSDSYTPQSLKLQIMLVVLLMAAIFGTVVLSHDEGRQWILMIGLAFVASTLPFLLLLLRLPMLERFSDRCHNVLKQCKKSVRKAGLRIRTGSLARLSAAGLRGVGDGLLSALRGVGMVLERIPVARIGRAIRWVAQGPIALGRGLGRLGTVAVVQFGRAGLALGRIPLRLAGAGWRSRPVQALRRGWCTLARMKTTLVLLALPLLFLRALVMGLGVLWGLHRQHVAREHFSRVMALLLADIFAVAGTYVVVYFTRFYLIGNPANPKCPGDAYFYLGFLLVGLCLASFSLSGLYGPSEGVGRINELVKMIKALFWVAIGLIAGMYWTRYAYSRLLIAGVFLVLPVTVSGARGLMRRLLRRLPVGDPDIDARRLLIVGLGEMAEFVYRKLCAAQDIDPMRSVIGFVAPSGMDVPAAFCGRDVLGSVDDLDRLVAEHRITDVIVAMPQATQPTLMSIADLSSRRLGVHCHVISNVFDLIAAENDLAVSNGIPSTYLRNENMALVNVLVKRVFDVGMATLAIVATAPIWLLIWIAIRLESEGPAFFRQERVGQHGRLLRVFKFRTMYVDTPVYAYAPSHGDKRVTRVGRFLRRTSLDELPQFINVLNGEMSMVGPRPEMPFIVAQYSEWERLRLTVKPGLTGLWQIMGRKDLPLHESLEYDFYYIKNQSLLLDLVIVIRTIGVVLSGKGAY